MANFSNPGFVKIVSDYSPNTYTASGAIAQWDVLAISSGKVAPYSEGASGRPIGFALQSASSDGDELLVADDPNLQFVMQTSGSYTPGTHNGTVCDLEGATGTYQVNEDASDSGSIHIVSHYDQLTGAKETGTNARVLCRWGKHALASANPASEGAQEYDSIATDTINERTSAAGVTVDGVLLKDGGNMNVVSEINALNNSGAGYTAVDDADDVSADDLTDNTGGEADTIIADVSTAVGEGQNTGSADKADVDARLVAIDGNFADLTAQQAKLKADVTELRTQLNLLLARLRVTGGAGVIADS